MEAGSLTMIGIVVTLEVLSFLFLLIIVKIFRSQSEKYQLLIGSFDRSLAQNAPGRILVPLYYACTIVSSVVIVLITIFQPHLL